MTKARFANPLVSLLPHYSEAGTNRADVIPLSRTAQDFRPRNFAQPKSTAGLERGARRACFLAVPHPSSTAMTRLDVDDLYGFLASEFADADLERKTDEQVVRSCITPLHTQWHGQVLAQGRAALASSAFPWREVAHYANRDLRTEEAAAEWLTAMLDLLEHCLNRAAAKKPAP